MSIPIASQIEKLELPTQFASYIPPILITTGPNSLPILLPGLSVNNNSSEKYKLSSEGSPGLPSELITVGSNSLPILPPINSENNNSIEKYKLSSGFPPNLPPGLVVSGSNPLPILPPNLSVNNNSVEKHKLSSGLPPNLPPGLPISSNSLPILPPVNGDNYFEHEKPKNSVSDKFNLFPVRSTTNISYDSKSYQLSDLPPTTVTIIDRIEQPKEPETYASRLLRRATIKGPNSLSIILDSILTPVVQKFETIPLNPIKEQLPDLFIDCDGKKCGRGVYAGQGSYVCPHNNLKVKYPLLCEEWDYDKNKKGPEDYLPGSNKRVYWICKKEGICECHRWRAIIQSRTKDNRGCPYCNSNKACVHNNFARHHPELIDEWDFEQNKRSPDTYTSRSHHSVHWICINNKVCDCHQWKTSIDNRSVGQGCPYCAGKKVCPHNNVAYLYPELMKEWNYEKNPIGPEKFTRGSERKVWWICKDKHEWQSRIGNRAINGASCPRCVKSGCSKMQMDWLNSIMEEQHNFIQTAMSPEGEVNIPGVGKVDGYDHNSRTVYEFHGSYWHGDPRKFQPDNINETVKKTFGALYQKTIERDAKIRDLGFNLIVKWELDWVNEIAAKRKLATGR